MRSSRRGFPRGIRLGMLVAAVCALFLAACASTEAADDELDGGGASGDTLQVAAYNFAENQIVANLYAGALNAAGHKSVVRTLTNREIIIPAVQQNEMQVVGDFVGTLAEFLNKQQNGPDAPAVASPDLDDTMANLRKLASETGLVVLEPAEAKDQNAYAVRKEFADEHNLKTISDLAAYSKDNPISLGGPPECPQRPFCLPGLEETYGLNVSEFVSLDAGGPLTKSALKQGKVDAGMVLTSDGALDQFGLVILKDDKNLQAVDNIVPVLSTQASNPDVDATLNAVSAKLTTEALQELNYKVDWGRQNPADVANEWLTQNGLV